MTENKFIVAKENRIARMKLFTEIDSEGYTLDRFLYEFESLQQDDSIDEIEILINSLGGSVFKGWPIITAINNSSKPVTTVIDTVAASMAALIFLAGKKRKMYSYSQLMLHAARYNNSNDTDDALNNVNQNIFDFLKGLTKKAKDKIKQWLSKDTWFTALQAIENNLATEIIEAKMVLVDSFQSEVRELVASGTYAGNNNNLKNKYSNMNEIINALKLEASVTEEQVKAKIEELMAVENTVADLENKLQIREQEIQNRESKIQDLENKLNVYVLAEKKKREEEIDSLVNSAFADRKINAEGKAVWKKLLETDFDSASKAIQALSKTEKLSDMVNDGSEENKIEFQLDPIQALMFNKTK